MNSTEKSNSVQNKVIGNYRSDLRIAVILIVFACVLLFWELSAWRSRQPFKPLRLGIEDFRGFRLGIYKSPSQASVIIGDWIIKPLPVPYSETEPNILVYHVFPVSGSAGAGWPVRVRLVHGYNMPDCMRIKGYTVERLKPVMMMSTTDNSISPHSLWKLRSSYGNVSIWATTVLNANNFSIQEYDITSFPFPKVGIPDEPGWSPRGITLDNLKHPIKNFKLFLRAKWNASRCDVATFLRLKRPAWVSDDMLVLVSASNEQNTDYDESLLTKNLLMSHSFVLTELQKWFAEHGGSIISNVYKK